MKQTTKIILLALATCLITIGMTMFIQEYILLQLPDWTFKTFHKYLGLYMPVIDGILIQFFPMLIAVLYIQEGERSMSKYFLRFAWTLLSVVVSLFLAYFVALQTWPSNAAESPLIPDYIKLQPFDNYWTVFILLGILLPWVITRLRQMSVAFK